MATEQSAIDQNPPGTVAGMTSPSMVSRVGTQPPELGGRFPQETKNDVFERGNVVLVKVPGFAHDVQDLLCFCVQFDALAQTSDDAWSVTSHAIILRSTSLVHGRHRWAIQRPLLPVQAGALEGKP